MTATEIANTLIDMALTIEERGDLGPYRVWDEHRHDLDDDAHHTIKRIVTEAAGSRTSADLAAHFRRAARAFQ